MLCEHANEVPRICPCLPTCGCRYYSCKIEAKKHEIELKGKLMEAIRARFAGVVAFPHQDVVSIGIPDISLTGFGRTTWWECKHGTPDFESQGRQELTMLRLAAAGFARYIIWHENADGTSKRTLIVHPKQIGDLIAEEWCVGFNFQFVVDYMKRVHQ